MLYEVITIATDPHPIRVAGSIIGVDGGYTASTDGNDKPCAYSKKKFLFHGNLTFMIF